jgi:hypothetical protein
MQLPLKLKWLGGQTEEICALLARHHPLILVSPAPRLPSTRAGVIPLPGTVSTAWDLRSPRMAKTLAGVGPVPGKGVGFEAMETASGARVQEAVHEFYFKIYLKSTALRRLHGVPFYLNIEGLHQRLLKREYEVFIRATLDREVVAGCLLRRASAGQAEDYRELLTGRGGEDYAGGERDVLVFDMLAIDERFGGELSQLTFAQAATWARSNGYTLLSTTPTSALVVSSDTLEPAWTFGGESVPVLHRRAGALLYCDLARCSHLPRDFFYIADEQPSPCLYYVANLSGGEPRAVRLLNSVTGIRKHVYTRRPQLWEAALGAGVDCTLLG